MKKFTILPLLFLTLFGFAQKQFVVQGHGTTQTFEDINVAIGTAQSGDTLYIPGGGFDISPATIDKTLHWRGTGHYPDSTVATGVSRINTTLTFTGNVDESTFEGIYFKGNLTFGSADDEATNITISKCRIVGTLTLRSTNNTDDGYPNLSFHLTESLVCILDANNGSNCLIENSLIFQRINEFHKSIFNFNIISFYDARYNRLFQHCTNCKISNNIITSYNGLYYTYNCTFVNNLFSGNLPYNPEQDTHTGSGNITNIPNDEIFKAITGSVTTFSYDNDYHLKEGCPGIGAANDGTNIGIYGSATSYKEGAVPYNPHIRTVAIDDEATNGELGVKISVAAQER